MRNILFLLLFTSFLSACTKEPWFEKEIVTYPTHATLIGFENSQGERLQVTIQNSQEISENFLIELADNGTRLYVQPKGISAHGTLQVSLPDGSSAHFTLKTSASSPSDIMLLTHVFRKMETQAKKLDHDGNK